MKKALLLLAFLNIGVLLFAQDVIRPILLDKSVLSGVGLRKIDIKDEPEKDFYQKRLYRGADISIYVVSTETWNNQMKNFPFDEFIYMFNGEACIRPESGPAEIFHSGDYFFAPRGFTGDWEIRAGKNFHYELSVISTSRADSSQVSSNLKHQLFEPYDLSGTQINLEEDKEFVQNLRQGIELSVSLKAELPSEKILMGPTTECMIHLLSGQISFEDSTGSEQTFYTGDFFVIPNAFHGKWKSQGHGLIKYLQVEKTKK